MSYSRNRSDSPPLRIEPEFNGYQLIGDSQFLRFSEQLLKLPRIQNNGIAYRGLCVSGQKAGDLLRRVRDNFANVSEKVVLMIGTNDLLRGTSFENMRDDLRSLLKQLRSKGAERIILLTVPPVPRLKSDADHWNRLIKFNEFIRQCHDGKNTVVADAYAKFVVPKERKSPPSRRSAPSRSLFINGCGTAEVPSICHLKEGTIRVSIGDKAARQVFYSGDGHEYERPPLRLHSRSSMPLPGGDQFGRHGDARTAVARRRAHSPDADSDEDCRPPSAKRRYSPPGSSARNRSRSSTSSAASRSSSFGGDSYSKADDDHDDGFGRDDRDDRDNRDSRDNRRAEDEAALKNADDVRSDLFEQFFGRGPRLDLIHLNLSGLYLIRGLIQDIIRDYF